MFKQKKERSTQHMLISINGYYGSGGNELGKALAKDLGYTVYDNDLMEKAVAKSGIDMQRSTLAFYDEDDAKTIRRDLFGRPLSNDSQQGFEIRNGHIYLK